MSMPRPDDNPATLSRPLPKHMERGQRRREEVMELAVKVATSEGLEALTIGRVAQEAGYSKPGLLSHFHTKEALQLATLQAGRDDFVRAVTEPARADEPGMRRVAKLIDRWVEHIANTPGGCFFASVAAEFDARPGPVRDKVASLMAEWIRGLEYFLREARQQGHLAENADVAAIAFRLHGFELSLNLRRQLFGDVASVAMAKCAMFNELRAQATKSGCRILDQESSLSGVEAQRP